MFDQIEVSGRRAGLEEAARTTDEVFSADAKSGLVGRMDVLLLWVKRLENGGVEILSYSRLEDGGP